MCSSTVVLPQPGPPMIARRLPSPRTSFKATSASLAGGFAGIRGDLSRSAGRLASGLARRSRAAPARRRGAAVSGRAAARRRSRVAGRRPPRRLRARCRAARCSASFPAASAGSRRPAGRSRPCSGRCRRRPVVVVDDLRAADDVAAVVAADLGRAFAERDAALLSNGARTADAGPRGNRWRQGRQRDRAPPAPCRARRRRAPARPGSCRSGCGTGFCSAPCCASALCRTVPLKVADQVGNQHLGCAAGRLRVPGQRLDQVKGEDAHAAVGAQVRSFGGLARTEHGAPFAAGERPAAGDFPVGRKSAGGIAALANGAGAAAASLTAMPAAWQQSRTTSRRRGVSCATCVGESRSARIALLRSRRRLRS
jgi:hypothetical protein